ncbi:hypothetical protein D3880_15835 [Pseudomonas cavernae]|uniref:Lipoprotein n=1 Tax=Pseudomonas cavernae TaxID=2320867 RepID=A0A385Z4R0_9PSED|nr:hypothetical protein [Pseudomonas cavernae]AYC33734.1 hypothetical protein D3880_15835 [Pseudomonas cavernae]
MQRSFTLFLAALILMLSGCAAQPSPSERPYTEAQVKQFALEMLSRSSLSYEDYDKLRRALMNPAHRMSNSIKDIDAQQKQIGGRG